MVIQNPFGKRICLVMALLVYILLCFVTVHCSYVYCSHTHTHTIVSLSRFTQCWVWVKEVTGRGRFVGTRAGSLLTAWRRWLSAAWSPVQVRLLIHTHTHYTHVLCIKEIHALIVPDVGVGQSDCHSFCDVRLGEVEQLWWLLIVYSTTGVWERPIVPFQAG